MTEGEFVFEEFEECDYKKAEDVERWKWSREVDDNQGNEVLYAVQIQNTVMGWRVQRIFDSEILHYDANSKNKTSVLAKNYIDYINKTIEDIDEID